MQYGFVITTGDPRTIADQAAAAEAAGWDGVFYWDAIAVPGLVCWDPWVVMAAMAMRTERVRIGAVVVTPSRRRPWKLARETQALDHLSGGRLVLPVGLGVLDDMAFGAVGEPTEARIRAELLDESLAILDGLWSGEPFGFEGKHYRFPPMQLTPPTLQRPRIPVWVVGAWPSEKSMARAARWDGLVAQPLSTSGVAPGTWTPDGLRPAVDWVREHRPVERRDSPYEVVMDGKTPSDDPVEGARIVRSWADVGVTWWLETDWSPEVTVDAQRRRIEAGPPRI